MNWPMTRKTCHFQSCRASTLGAHALSAAVSLHPIQPGPELRRGHRRGRDGLLSIAAEAQRSRRGHPQARAGPGSGPEANLGSGQQPQGNWHNKMYRAHIKCFQMNFSSLLPFKALKVNLYLLHQASESSETEGNV